MTTSNNLKPNLDQPFTIQNTCLNRCPEGLTMIQNCGPIPTAIQNPNCDSRPIYTLNCRFPSHHIFLQSSMISVLNTGMGAASSISPLLSFVFNTSARCSFSIYEGSWVLLSSPLPWMQRLSSLLGRFRYSFLWLSCSDIVAFPIVVGPFSNNSTYDAYGQVYYPSN